jgi:tRNA/tmRNA/rRNA uracil-C5-methylase (TrmA/RlmC/RlmD family)
LLVRDLALGKHSADSGAEPPPPPPLPPPPRVLLDVCCGTGTIALICAQSFTRVVGVELEASAIVDARANAELNALTNAAVICDRAEAAMRGAIDAAASGSAAAAAAPSMLPPAAESGGGAAAAAAAAPPAAELVAVVDPPRSGLHASVIRSLRTCRTLRRVVYVSCNPTVSFLEDAVRLCCPPEKNSAFAAGPPFRPVVARAVDLFPHTPHLELVCLFERAV